MESESNMDIDIEKKASKKPFRSDWESKEELTGVLYVLLSKRRTVAWRIFYGIELTTHLLWPVVSSSFFAQSEIERIENTYKKYIKISALRTQSSQE